MEQGIDTSPEQAQHSGRLKNTLRKFAQVAGVLALVSSCSYGANQVGEVIDDAYRNIGDSFYETYVGND